MTFSTPALATGVLAALAVAATFPARPGHAGTRLRGLPTHPVMRLLPAAGAAGVLPFLVSGRRLVLALIITLSVVGVVSVVARARRRATAERRADRVHAFCLGLAGDLRAGEPPLRALDRAAVEWPEVAPVATAARIGADVPASLRALARLVGAEQLTVVAAAWQVAERSGSGLADAVDQAARSITERRTTRRLVRGDLASAHATARMMAALPFVMLLLGGGLGTDPVGFLTDTPVGLACLGTGLALSYLGVRWLDRITEGVLR